MTSRYRLLAKWATGGMADVYLARQGGAAGFDKLVALKFLRDAGESSTFREMFLEEVRTTALLNHSNIVQTFDAGELSGRLFMAMEFVHGETLGKFAHTVSRAGGSFPIELAVAIVRDLATALDYAHTLTNLAGTPMELVHRDVSPSNIIVSFDGMVKLLDFGVAKIATKLQPTSTGMIKGKFSYMSPEQARGEQIDHRSDIYSLGLILWQLLTGKKAYDAPSDAELFRMIIAPQLGAPSTAGARCTPALDDIVMEAIAPGAGDRYATAGDFATALSRYLARHAAGFDSAKLIRALMVANFGDRREKLADLVRRSDDEAPLVDELEHSMRSLTQHESKHATSSQAAIPVSVQPERVDLRRRTAWPLAVLVLAGAAMGGGYLAVRDHDAGQLAGDLAQHIARVEPDAMPAIEVPALVVTEPPAPPIAAMEIAEEDAAQPKTTKRPPVRIASKAPAKLRRADKSTPIDAGAPDAPPDAAEPAPAPVAARIEKPAAVAPPRPAPVVNDAGSLDAMPSLTKVAVNGSLPTSEVHSALERAQSAFRGCYRAAAAKAKQTPALAIRISFVIDESRATHSIKVAGDAIGSLTGLAGCVQSTIGNLRTRSAPDVGTVAVVAQISFKPVAN